MKPELLLSTFLLIPLLGFIISIFLPKRSERALAAVAIATPVLLELWLVAFTIHWLINGHAVLDVKQFTVYSSVGFEFFIDLYFDKITVVHALVGSILAAFVSIFSKFYLHRDEGFKRFFNTIQFFFLGYCIIIFSGNFETLFLGWEVIGLSSFLLISFYRDRYLPARNGLKVLSFYRLSDICLILAMWMSHHLWHANITFSQLSDTAAVQNHFLDHPAFFTGLAFVIFLAAAIKSAQFPFSTWLPRAMEGPTSSSAIFYGSLSVHVGIFVLLRTMPLWQDILLIKVAIITVGALTALLGTAVARVQPTVKTQIAYSSAAQIGIIFIEVALGFENIALIHFACNAFLRTYQLLVSPSVLNYLIHNMFFSFVKKEQQVQRSFSSRIRNTIYMLSVKEWNLDHGMRLVFWSPFKWIGKHLQFLGSPAGLVSAATLAVGAIVLLLQPQLLPESAGNGFTITLGSIAGIFLVGAFSSRGDAVKTWLMIFTAQVFLTLAFANLHAVSAQQIMMYFSGIGVATLVGLGALQSVRRIDGDVALNRYHGYAHERPLTAFVFLLSVLGMIAFPITTAFVGLDVMFTAVQPGEPWLLILCSVFIVIVELSAMRIYARIFMGTHKKLSHPVAYRSS